MSHVSTVKKHSKGKSDMANDDIESFASEVRDWLAVPDCVDRFSQLCAFTGCSRPTARRWARGDNAPHPAYRPVVLKFIRENP